ncbi:MAG: hypothetical protein KJ674_04600 [Nanoarchaeota archaeon]|nr:hypothetical protein [Nanoarchaeota archaeon]
MKKSIMFLLILSIGALFVISGCSNTPVGQKINSQQGQTPDSYTCQCQGGTNYFTCRTVCADCCGSTPVEYQVNND